MRSFLTFKMSLTSSQLSHHLLTKEMLQAITTRSLLQEMLLCFKRNTTEGYKNLSHRSNFNEQLPEKKFTAIQAKQKL